jgi:hypothetical protein
VRGRVALFDLFLGLVAGTRASACTDRGADDGTRRPGHCATDERPSGTATERAGPGTGLVIAFGRLAGDRTADGTDGATDDSPRRASDGHPDGRAAERTGTGADGLVAVLLVLERRSVGVVVLRIERIVVLKVPPVLERRGLLRVHWGLLVALAPATSPAR